MTSLQTREEKSIWEHVGELRKKLLIALVVFVIGAIVAHIFNAQITAFILKPATDSGQNLIFLSPIEPIIFIFKIDFIGGFILSFPIIIWCLFSYITPALSKRISNIVVFLYVTSTFLLYAGLLYAFFIMIPITLKFLFSITIPGIVNTFSAKEYISFFIIHAAIIMAIFQLPIIIIGGVHIGLLKTKMFTNKRKYVYFALLIILAVVTPTTDMFSLMIIFVPCMIIFEISLIGGRIVEALKRKRQSRESNSEIAVD